MYSTTVCVLTSGIGSRLGVYTNDINKALLPINKKAAITYIIEKFPKGTNFIIALGHKGDLVKQFLKTNHNEINFKFVYVDNFNKPGSGPGYSLAKCKKYLNKSFYFVSCDTLWDEKLLKESKNNWMAIPKQRIKQSKDYCNLVVKNKVIVKIVDKKKTKEKSFPFTGLAFIKDYQEFWSGFKLENQKINEPQVSIGFNNLLKVKKIKIKTIEWTDIGTQKKYEEAFKKYEIFDFRKNSQLIYISKDKVTKFFLDDNIVKNLINKVNNKNDVYPKIISHTKNFFSYKYFNGSTYYNFYTPKNLSKLLLFLEDKLWKKKKLSKKKIKIICLDFYKNKTYQRLKLFKKKYPLLEKNEEQVDELSLKKISVILKKFPWEDLIKGLPYEIHGDLQFDNILFDNNKKKFQLIDWRPNFSKSLIIGDLLYDFAKLLGGLEINYDLIKQNKFKFKKKRMVLNFI